MNTDFRVSVTFTSNPNTRLLRRQYGTDAAWALIELWTWATINRASGIFTGMNEDQIEAAADWNGKRGELIKALVAFEWLTKNTDGVYVLNQWAETNAWAADAENRSDKSRLSSMARNYPELYEALTAQGVTGIDSASYAKLTAEYNSRGILRSSSTSLRAASVAAAPKPKPSPVPTPTPEPSLLKEEVVRKSSASSSALGKDIPSVEAPGMESPSTKTPSPEASKLPKSSKSPTTPKTATKPDNHENLSGQSMSYEAARKTLGQTVITFEQEETPANQEPATLAGVLSEWNVRLGTLGFPKVAKVTPRRKAAFDARLCVSQERSSLAWWVALFEKIAASDFMRESASQKANWLTIDWVLNEHNMMKILEGKYDSERPVIADIFRAHSKYGKRSRAQEVSPNAASSSTAPNEATADGTCGMSEETQRGLSEMYRAIHGTEEGNPYGATFTDAIEAEFSPDDSKEMQAVEAEHEASSDVDTYTFDEEEYPMTSEEEAEYQSWLEELEELNRQNKEEAMSSYDK